MQKRSLSEGEPEQILLTMKRKTDGHLVQEDSENNDIRVTYVTLCAVFRVAKISLKRNVKYAEDEAEHILQETEIVTASRHMKNVKSNKSCSVM